MGQILEFNCLLRIPDGELDLNNLEQGKRYNLIKDGERLYPLNIAVEICDSNYKFYGKIAVRKLTIEADKTSLEFEVLKVFDANESEVFTKNFIKS